MTTTIVGTIRMAVIYRHSRQVHPATDYKLTVCDGTYLFDDKPIEEAQHVFWIENAAHADHGMTFLKDVIEDHRNERPYHRLKTAFTSCGETLDLEFIPAGPSPMDKKQAELIKKFHRLTNCYERGGAISPSTAFFSELPGDVVERASPSTTTPTTIPVEAIRAPSKSPAKQKEEELNNKIQSQKIAYDEVVLDLSQRSASLQNDNEMLHGQVQGLQALLSELHKVHAAADQSYQTMCAGLTNELKESLTREEATASKLKQAEDTNKLHNDAIVKLNEGADFTKKLQDELADTKARLEAAQSVISTHGAFVGRLHANRATLILKVDELQNDLDQTRAKLVVSEGVIRDQANFISQLDDDRSSLTEKVMDLRAKNAKLESAIHDQKGYMEHLAEERDDWIKQVKMLESKVVKLEDQRSVEVTVPPPLSQKQVESHLWGQVADATKKSEELTIRQGDDTLSKQLQVCKHENETLKQRNVHLAKTNTTHEETIHSLRDIIVRLGAVQITESEAKGLDWYKVLKAECAKLKTDLIEREHALAETREIETLLRKDNDRLEKALVLIGKIGGAVLRITSDGMNDANDQTPGSFDLPLKLVIHLGE